MDRNRKGFTLVELMIVLAIIAIVATLAIVNLSTSEMAANETAAVAGLRSLVTAEKEHKRDESTYAALADLSKDGNHRVPQLEDGEEKGYTFAEIEAPTEGSFSFCAYPKEDGKTGVMTFIVNESGTVWKIDNDSTAVAAWPADPAAAGYEQAQK